MLREMGEGLKRDTGIEPVSTAWEAVVLPLNQSRRRATGTPLGRSDPGIIARVRREGQRFCPCESALSSPAPPSKPGPGGT
jgi:hypothetical protein